MHTYTQPVYIFECAHDRCIRACVCVCVLDVYMFVYVYMYRSTCICIYIYLRDLPLTMRHGGVCLISGRFLTRKMNRGFQRIPLCALIEHPHAEDIWIWLCGYIYQIYLWLCVTQGCVWFQADSWPAKWTLVFRVGHVVDWSNIPTLRTYEYEYVYVHLTDLPLTMRHAGVCLISDRVLTRKMNLGFQRLLLCWLVEYPKSEDRITQKHTRTRAHLHTLTHTYTHTHSHTHMCI